MPTTRLAIIGAGISGLTLAHKLQEKFNVTLFEKANRPGGRVTSKVIDGVDFDYGAQFFTAKTSAFQSFVDEMQSIGVVGIWNGHFIEFDHTDICSERDWDESYPHYVGTPNMSAIGNWLAEPLTVHYETPVTELKKTTSGWQLLQDDIELGEYDWVVLTMPPPQVSQLLAVEHAFQSTLSKITMQACFALRVALKNEQDIGFNAALVRNHDISWISKNSSKPERSTMPSIVVHATNAWADAHLNEDLQHVENHMLKCLADITQITADDIAHSDVKRWVYANAPKQTGNPFLVDKKDQIAVCGDGFIKGRIESAYMSANKLAQFLSASVTTN